MIFLGPVWSAKKGVEMSTGSWAKALRAAKYCVDRYKGCGASDCVGVGDDKVAGKNY